MKDLTKGNIYKTFILFAIPLVLSGILSQGYNIIDTIIAGKFLGDSGLAAIGATAAFISLVSSVFWGYGTGFSIYTARLFGAGDYKELKTAIINSLCLVISTSILLAVFVILFSDTILELLRVDVAIRADAKLYLAVYMCGLCSVVFNNNCLYIMNSLGLSSYPFYMSIISAVMNVAGNILTVAIFRMGVFGIGLSTVVSALTVNVCYILKLKKCFKELNVSKYKVKFGFVTFRKSFSYSVSVMIQQVIMYLSSMLVSPLVNGIGSAATAAYTVINKIYDINAGIYQNSAKTLANYTAQCIGAKKFDSIKKGVRVGLIQGMVLFCPVLLLCVVSARFVCSIFFPAGYEGDGLIYAVDFVKLYMPFLLINLINNLFHAFFRGTGSVKLLLISTFIGAASRYVFTVIFVNRYAMYGVYIGWVLSWAVEAVYSIVMYFTGRWKCESINKIVVRNENE